MTGAAMDMPHRFRQNAEYHQILKQQSCGAYKTQLSRDTNRLSFTQYQNEPGS